MEIATREFWMELLESGHEYHLLGEDTAHSAEKMVEIGPRIELGMRELAEALMKRAAEELPSELRPRLRAWAASQDSLDLKLLTMFLWHALDLGCRLGRQPDKARQVAEVITSAGAPPV